jgi:hypothetical protein
MLVAAPAASTAPAATAASRPRDRFGRRPWAGGRDGPGSGHVRKPLIRGEPGRTCAGWRPGSIPDGWPSGRRHGRTCSFGGCHWPVNTSGSGMYSRRMQ